MIEVVYNGAMFTVRKNSALQPNLNPGSVDKCLIHYATGAPKAFTSPASFKLYLYVNL